jgi:hypothetical protein
VAGLVFGVSSFLKQKGEDSTLQKEAQIDNQNQKDGKIAQLREKIAEINKKLQAPNHPALRDKRNIWLSAKNFCAYSNIQWSSATSTGKVKNRSVRRSHEVFEKLGSMDNHACPDLDRSAQWAGRVNSRPASARLTSYTSCYPPDE